MGSAKPPTSPPRPLSNRLTFTAACALLPALLAPAITAQRPRRDAPPPTAEQQQELRQRFEQYMERPFIENAPWQTEWSRCLEQAKEEDRFILGYFTFSFADNPGLGILETNVFATPEFARFAAGKQRPILFLHVMTRLPDRDNDDMRKVARSRGLPAIVFFAPDGSWAAKQVMGPIKEKRAADVERTLDALLTLRDAARVKGQDGETKGPSAAAVLHAELVLQKLDFKAADPRRKALEDVPEELAGAIDKMVDRLELDHLSIMFREQGIDAAGPLYVKMLDEGRAPTGNSNEAFGFWGNLINYALHRGDIPLAQQALAGLRKAGEGRPLLANAILGYERRVEQAMNGGR